MDDDDIDLQEQIFYNIIREHVVSIKFCTFLYHL